MKLWCLLVQIIIWSIQVKNFRKVIRKCIDCFWLFFFQLVSNYCVHYNINESTLPVFFLFYIESNSNEMQNRWYFKKIWEKHQHQPLFEFYQAAMLYTHRGNTLPWLYTTVVIKWIFLIKVLYYYKLFTERKLLHRKLTQTLISWPFLNFAKNDEKTSIIHFCLRVWKIKILFETKSNQHRISNYIFK